MALIATRTSSDPESHVHYMQTCNVNLQSCVLNVSWSLGVMKGQQQMVLIETAILFFTINVASVFSSRYVGSRHRILWSREQFCSDKLADIHKHLVDLVPPFYVNQLMVGCRHIECSPGRVAVLQLDVCNFTVISTSLEPTKLADIINSLFSDFDKYVVNHKLTKIDTM